jgi:hypothetical protein
VDGEELEVVDGEEVWPEHTNQLGDWCPWSGRPTKGGDICDATCPDSAVEHD